MGARPHLIRGAGKSGLAVHPGRRANDLSNSHPVSAGVRHCFLSLSPVPLIGLTVEVEWVSDWKVIELPVLSPEQTSTIIHK